MMVGHSVLVDNIKEAVFRTWSKVWEALYSIFNADETLYSPWVAIVDEGVLKTSNLTVC